MSKPLARTGAASASTGAEADAILWRDYARIAPGEYQAYCKWAGFYRDPGFRRWVCLLRWDVLASDLVRVLATIPMWFPLGSGLRPRASRRGKYLPEWVRAKGAAPLRGDRLSPRVFVRRIARVQVDYADSAAPYSVVRKIIAWETGSSGSSVNKSHSQGRQEESEEK
jgi:hypothetical protein